jgi:hypothetical protein
VALHYRTTKNVVEDAEYEMEKKIRKKMGCEMSNLDYTHTKIDYGCTKIDTKYKNKECK